MRLPILWHIFWKLIPIIHPIPRYNFYLTLSFLFISCIVNTIIDPNQDYKPNNRKYAKVAYYVPQYAQPNKGVLKNTFTAPIQQKKAGKILYYKDYLFVNTPMEGIHVFDNKDSKNPLPIGFLTLKGNIDMAIIDDHLYADQFSALVVLDIADINNIKFIDDFTVPEIFYYDRYWNFKEIESAKDYEYVRYDQIDDSKGIVVGWELEIRWEKIEPYRYILLDSAVEETSEDYVNESTSFNFSKAGSLARFLPIDNLLYTLNQWELILFEINGNHQPLRFGKTPTNTNAETLYRLNDFLFIGSVNGMLMYNINDPKNPEFLSRIDHFRSCDPVVADANYAYVTLRGGTNCFTDRNELQIISLEDPKNLKVVSRQLLFNPHGLAVHDNHVIVCDGSAGIKVIDITDRLKPEVVGTYPISFAYDVIINYPIATVVGEDQLYRFDISQLPKMEAINN